MERPLLILSDVHISRAYGGRAAAQLSALVTEHNDSEIVLAGDIFDLSLDPAHTPLEDSVGAAFAPHPGLKQALSSHVQTGGKLTLVPGNHDAALSQDGGFALRKLLAPQRDDAVEVSQWFARRGDVHIEHGHLYDPDCATNHPLADPSGRSEGLGTALMRRFVAPNDAFAFAHANQTTPASGLAQAVEHWGIQAPVVISNYFRAAISLCLEAGLHKERVRRQILQGEARIAHHAAQVGLDPTILQALVVLAPEPTHHSFRATFQRLYFDRILAGLGLVTGVGALASAGLGAGLTADRFVSSGGTLTTMGALLATCGGGYLALNVSRKKNRYGNAVVGQLSEAARGVAALTKSQLVVFGHTHVEVDEPGYVNLGSFGFGQPEKPFLRVDTNGHHTRGCVPSYG